MWLSKENQINKTWQKLAITLLVVIGVFGGVGGVGAETLMNQDFLREFNYDFGITDNDTDYILFKRDGDFVVMLQTRDGAQRAKKIEEGLYNSILESKQLNKIKEAYNGAPITSTVGSTIFSEGGTVEKQYNDDSRNVIAVMLAWILYYIASGLGAIMVLVAKVMLTVAVFNNFLSQPPVQAGWAILRDLCNNFFIILLLIMAGGIALRLPNYGLKTMLPKILISAVLINFSLMFTGVLIDVSQIVMLTFAGPLATSTGYGLILKSMNLPDAYSMSALMSSGTQVDNMTIGTWDVIVALFFAVIVTFVAIVVIGAIAIILVYRIVMLMFLAVLSPLPWLAKASNFSKLSSISNDWNSNLGNMLVVGPAMMFFLYISFLFFATPLNDDSMKQITSINDTTSVATGRDNDDLINKNNAPSGITSGPGSAYANISDMGTVNGLLKFMLTIGFLVGSLMMGQKFGGGAAKYASGAQNWLTKQGKKFSGVNLAGMGLKKAQQVPGAMVGKVGTGALSVASASLKGLGAGNKEGGIYKLGAFGSQWRTDVLESRRKARRNKLDAFMGKMGMGDKSKDAWGEFTDTDLAKGIKTAAVVAGGTVATVGTAVATGGAGSFLALPGFMSGLATVAAGYGSGYGRFSEILLGQWGQDRTKKREAEQKKIDEAKKATDTIVSDSETARDANIATDLQNYYSNPLHRQDKNNYDAAQKRLEDIEKAKLTNGNKRSGRGLDPEILAALRANNWNAGTEISEDMLNQAKNAVKNGIGSTVWADQQSIINNFQTVHQPILDNINNYRENEHRQNVINQLDGRVVAATTPEDRGLAETERRRFETEYDAKVTLDLHTDRINQALEDALNRINSNNRISESDKIVRRRAAQKTHDDDISRVNKERSDTIAPVQHQEPQPTAIDKFLEDYKPYAHENWVSQAVAKEARKIQETIKDLVSAIENGGADVLDSFDQISRGKFYSQSGQTEVQFKSIKALTDSTKGITNLIDSLTKMPKDISGVQAQLVKELKQGIAAYRKAGGDTTKLTAIITLLDQKKGKNKEGKIIDDKTVAEYETDIKPKK